MSLLPEANVISFARGIPSPDMFPLAQLAESAKRAVEQDGRVALNYGPPAGFGPLREWLGGLDAVALVRDEAGADTVEERRAHATRASVDAMVRSAAWQARP